MLRSTSKVTIFAALLLATIIVPSFFGTKIVQAISAGDWQSGNIIADSIFYDNGTMSTQDIQNFLNSKVPTCDVNGAKTSEFGGGTRAQYGTSKGYSPPYTCLKDYVENPTTHQNNANGGSVPGGVGAAQIIKTAADTYGISPKTLIVLLQKEQTLITDDWPWTSQYKSATGYGCPDTAPCDAQYYGFYNQVSNAAHQFLLYKNNPANYRYKPYQSNYIQYNPNAGCGGSNVIITNLATAGLYNYTPYQPNASALNNLYGSGDSCGAYGNRNFWRIFNDWFGSTLGATQMTGAPASVSKNPNSIDVFGHGADHALWQKTFDGSNGGWQPWTRHIGANITSTPALSSWGSGRLDIFGTASSGDLQHNWRNSGQWGSWESLGKPSPSVSLTSAPSAVSWGNGRIDVFGRGSDGALWQKWFSDSMGGWQPWVRMGGAINSAPTITTWAPGRLDVFSTGPAGDLQHIWFLNGWSNWESLGFPATSLRLTDAPSAVSWGNGRIDVFGRGSDGALWQKWFSDSMGGWQPWVRMGGGNISSPPTVSSWQSGRLDIFITGQVGDLRHLWFSNGWSNWESLQNPTL